MNTRRFLVSIITIILFLIGYYGYRNFSLQRVTNQKTQGELLSTNRATGSQIAENIYTLPPGEQIYNVSHGEKVVGPKMSQVIYTPLAFENGQSQKIKIVFPEKEVVGSVVLFINSDNRENQKVVLKKESKVNTWIGEWTPEDTIKIRYSVKIVAVGSEGEYNNTMHFL